MCDGRCSSAGWHGLPAAKQQKQCIVVASRTSIDAHAVLLEKVVDIGVKARLAALAQHHEDASASLHVVLQCFKLKGHGGIKGSAVGFVKSKKYPAQGITPPFVFSSSSSPLPPIRSFACNR